MRKLPIVLLVLFTLSTGCKKGSEEKDIISFEVICNGCSINYTDENGIPASESNIKTSFTKQYTGDFDFEMYSSSITDIKVTVTRRKGSAISNFFTGLYNKEFHLTYSSALGRVNDGSNNGTPGTTYGCGLYNGKTLYLGAQGGCYYITSGGNKSYVDRSYCKCN